MKMGVKASCLVTVVRVGEAGFPSSNTLPPVVFSFDPRFSVSICFCYLCCLLYLTPLFMKTFVKGDGFFNDYMSFNMSFVVLMGTLPIKTVDPSKLCNGRPIIMCQWDCHAFGWNPGTLGCCWDYC